MKNSILILVACDNNNIVYTAAVEEAKQEVISYFGKKHLVANEPDKPCIILDCDVDPDDIRNIKKSFDEDTVGFAVIRNTESKCIVGDFINLPE